MNNNVQAVLHRLQNSKALMLDFLCSLTFLSAFFPTYKLFEKVVHNCIHINKGIFLSDIFFDFNWKALDPPCSEESRKDSKKYLKIWKDILCDLKVSMPSRNSGKPLIDYEIKIRFICFILSKIVWWNPYPVINQIHTGKKI